jgi:cobalt-zinc-cadmium efflux system outer membrane protein
MKFRLTFLALTLSLNHAVAARAQLVGMADDIIMFSKGATEKGKKRKTTSLDQTPGTTAGLPHYDPSGRESALAEPASPAHSTPRAGKHRSSVISAVEHGPRTTRRSRPTPRVEGLALRHQMDARSAVPRLYGLLELPAGEWEGPARGLTLDQAITRLLSENPELRSKRYELPQARADVLTASQRANPLYFISANNLPYRPYSPGRFGAVQYAPTLVQPFDLNDKRGARVNAASHVLRVLEIQYQNAVRLTVHELYLAYTDVIVARETLRYAEVSQAAAKAMLEATHAAPADKGLSESDRLHLAVQYETTRLDVDQARSELVRAKHRLAALLAIPREQASRLEVRGRIRPPEPRLPGRDDLVRMALAVRPDVQAYRQGIDRACADAHLAKKERVDDIFIVYSPFVFQNNTPIDKQNVTSFSLGVMGSIPIFDRNQGEIRRADVNVSQTRTALAGIERQAAAEVESAFVEYHASREAVERLERTILPTSERARAIAHQQYAAGETSPFEYFSALRDRNEVVRQYRDALIRHRRSMLQLNTAVGRRLLP